MDADYSNVSEADYTELSDTMRPPPSNRFFNGETEMVDECGTLDFLADLDKASDTRKQNLCSTWKNARANDCDVLVENMMEFEARTGKKIYPCVRIKCALIYPKVYYECDVQDVTAGRGSPVMQKYSPNFDVHECAPNVMLMVEHFVRRVCKGYKVTEKLITDALKKMELSIKETA